MNRQMKPTVISVLLLLVFLLNSCTGRFTGDDATLYTGDRLTPDIIDSIFNELSEEITEKYPSETLENGSIAVYWLEGGSVWHLSSSCPSIQNADPSAVMSGDIYEAFGEGKTRGCKVCSKDSEITLELTDAFTDESSTQNTQDAEKYPKEYDSEGNLIVYWTESGSVWHESVKCGSVTKADPAKLFSGTAQEAYLAGKERACKVCSADSDVTIVIPETTAPDVTTIKPETTQAPETTVPEDTTERYPKEYDPEGNVIVYWTESGSVWHESAKCGTVTKADPAKLFSGTAQEAYLAGKERACKVCSADSDITIVIPETTVPEITTAEPETTQAPETTVPEDTTERYPKEYDPEGNVIVYWTESGSVWHESAKCGTVTKADPSKLFCGTAQEAYLAGKERACKVCSADSDITIVIPETTVPEITTTAPETTQAPETTVPEETTERYPKEYDSDGNVIVYWTEGGSVWHESSKCGTVMKADPSKLFSGTAQEAYFAGKDRACKVCSADSDITIVIPETTVSEPETTLIPETTESSPIPDVSGEEVVYWTQNGSVWHLTTSCSSLSRTDPNDILSGDVDEAVDAGKERVCKKCSD